MKPEFIYESPDVPKMVELREKYQLKAVIAGKTTELEQFTALLSWVQTRWSEHGSDQITETNDSLKILEAAADGMNFQCWYYATVFVQCATALGFKARRLKVTIHPALKRTGNTGHIIAEIWSNDYQKWLVMDGDMNAYYKINGIPASALEIHHIWINQQLDKIEYIQLLPVPKMIAKQTPEQRAREFVFGAYDVIDYYFQLQIVMRNNWFSADKENSPAGLAWIDKFHPEYTKRVGKIIDDVLWTDNPELFA